MLRDINIEICFKSFFNDIKVLVNKSEKCRMKIYEFVEIDYTMYNGYRDFKF